MQYLEHTYRPFNKGIDTQSRPVGLLCPISQRNPWSLTGLSLK